MSVHSPGLHGLGGSSCRCRRSTRPGCRWPRPWWAHLGAGDLVREGLRDDTHGCRNRLPDLGEPPSRPRGTGPSAEKATASWTPMSPYALCPLPWSRAVSVVPLYVAVHRGDGQVLGVAVAVDHQVNRLPGESLTLLRNWWRRARSGCRRRTRRRRRAGAPRPGRRSRGGSARPTKPAICTWSRRGAEGQQAPTRARRPSGSARSSRPRPRGAGCGTACRGRCGPRRRGRPPRGWSCPGIFT